MHCDSPQSGFPDNDFKMMGVCNISHILSLIWVMHLHSTCRHFGRGCTNRQYSFCGTLYRYQALRQLSVTSKMATVCLLRGREQSIKYSICTTVKSSSVYLWIKLNWKSKQAWCLYLNEMQHLYLEANSEVHKVVCEPGFSKSSLPTKFVLAKASLHYLRK